MRVWTRPSGTCFELSVCVATRVCVSRRQQKQELDEGFECTTEHGAMKYAPAGIERVSEKGVHTLKGKAHSEGWRRHCRSQFLARNDE